MPQQPLTVRDHIAMHLHALDYQARFPQDWVKNIRRDWNTQGPDRRADWYTQADELLAQETGS